MSKRLITGKVLNHEEPDWEPLARFASPYLMSSFMWMFEVATRRGERFHAYKHIATRRTAHIDINGNGLAYVFDEDRYARYPAWVLLRAVLRPWWEELNATPEEIALSQNRHRACEGLRLQLLPHAGARAAARPRACHRGGAVRAVAGGRRRSRRHGRALAQLLLRLRPEPESHGRFRKLRTAQG